MITTVIQLPGTRRGGKHTPAAQGGKWLYPGTRWAIYHRDGFRCVYCRSPGPLSIDHVRPARHGAHADPENLVTCCLSCNSSKRDLSFRRWMKLLRRDGKDTSRVLARLRRARRSALDREVGRLLVEARGDGGDSAGCLWCRT